MNNNRWLQALIILLVIIAASWLLGQTWLLLIQFSNIILLFFLGWLLAFALNPIARRLQGAGMPQGGAVTVVYLAMLLVLALVGLLIFPALSDQIQRLINETPTYTDQLTKLGNDTLLEMKKNWGLRVEDLHIDTLYGTLGEQVKNVGGSVLQFVSGVAGFLFNAIIVLLLSFYFMKDGERLFNNAVGVLPPALAEEVQLMGDSVGRAFGGFLRGQMVFAFLYAILNAIIMSLFNLDYILIASIAAGLAMVIPIVGGFLAYVPPLLIILVTPAAIGNWWVLLIVLFIVQTLMTQVISPRILSQAIGLHPLFVVAALLAGLQIAGAWGALFGIPIAGVAQQVAGPYFARLRAFFHVPAPEQPALALEGTVTGPTLTLPVIMEPAPAGDGDTAPATAPLVPIQASTLLVLARGLSRRALSLRRRPRA